MSALTPRPTPAQLRVMAAYVRAGSQKAAAQECGIALRTAKNHLTGLYARLGAGGAMEALAMLGWIVIPPIDEGRHLVAEVDLSFHPAQRGFAASVQHGRAAALISAETFA